MSGYREQTPELLFEPTQNLFNFAEPEFSNYYNKMSFHRRRPTRAPFTDASQTVLDNTKVPLR